MKKFTTNLFAKRFIGVLATLLIVGAWSSAAWGISKTKLTVNISGAGQIKVNTSSAEPSDWSSSSVTKNQSHGTLDIQVTDYYYIWVKPDDGYYCSGVSDCSWDDNGYYTISFKGSTTTASKTVTATFVGNTYYLAFHGNGNSAGSMTNQQFTYGTKQKIKSNTFSKGYSLSFDANGGNCDTETATATYTFAGWATSANGSVVYTNQQEVNNLTIIANKTIDLYAVWSDGAVTLPEATREGFLFDGWYAGDTWVGKGGDNYQATADVELTAHWAEKYTPMFVLDKTEIELEGTAKLTLTNVDNPTIEIAPEGIVSYNTTTGAFTGLAVGEASITITQQGTDVLSYKQETLNIKVTKKASSLAVLLNGVERSSIVIYQGSTATVQFNKVSDSEVVVTTLSGGKSASYANGVITAGEIGKATFRATLSETDTYQSIYVDFEVEVQRDPVHLPLTMTGSIWNNGNIKVATEGTTSWEDANGIVLGDVTWGGTNKDDKYVILHFEGIPDKLNFKIATPESVGGGIGSALGGVTNVEWFIKESATSTMPNATIWTETYDGTSPKSYSIELQPTTRYVLLCYSGNFGAYFKDVNITERKYVQDPEPASIDFGKAVINSTMSDKTVNINWCNVAPLTVTSDNPYFTVSPSVFGSYEQMSSQELTIAFTHTNEVGEYEGNIIISNGESTYDKTIPVKAEITKRKQVITWNKDLKATGFAMSVGEQYPDETITKIATTPNGELITFVSANSDIIEVVDDTVLVAKAVGKVNIIAHQAGDNEYAEVKDTVEFTVTNLLKQTITWDQNLYGLLTTSEPVELTATATSGMQITYTSANENVVRIEDNTLIVVGEGETTITAYQAGGIDLEGNEWLEISQDNYVIVRNPESQCNEKALAIGSLTLSSGELSKIYDLAGTPTTLTFKAKHGTKPNGAWEQKPTYAALMVDQYTKIDGAWGWQNKYNEVVGTEDTDFKTIELDSIATKVRFRTTETGTEHTISNVQVPRMKFMTADVEVIDLDVESNAIWSQTITVSHSNIDLMTVTTKQGVINLSTATLGGGCGSYGDDAFVASFTPMQKYQEFLDTIVITDGKADPSTIEIPVRLYSKGLNQSITGFELQTTAKTTDEIFLSASASSELEVTFSTSNDNIAYVGENNKLVIVTSGEVIVYAIQEGNEKYDPAQAEQTILISKVAAPITANPTASDLKYGQTLAESELSNGAATVDGTFAWEDGNIVPDAGNQTFKVIFTPENAAWYESSSVDVTVHVDKADAELVKAPTATEISFGQTLADAQLIGGEATFDGEFVWADPTIAPQSIGEFGYDVNFVPANPDNYNGFTITVKVTVNKQAPAITVLPTATAITYGQTLADSQLSGGEAVTEGTFAWADPTIAPEAGTSEQYVIFTPDDTENFGKATLTVNVTVAKAESEVLSAPRAIQPLAYNGETQELILPGEAKGGTMVYSLDGQNFSEDLPKATEIGEYTVYFRVAGDANHNDSEIDYITAAILDPSEVKQVQTITWNQELGNMPFNQSIQLEATCTSGDEVFFEIIVGNYEIAYINDFNVLFTYETEGLVKVRAYVEETDDYYYAELEKQFNVFDPTTTPVDQTSVQTKAQKIIRNNQLLIIRDGKTYNAAGLLVE